MYSLNQIKSGILNPYSAVNKISEDIQHQIKRRKPHNYGIQGSYRTGNIGDLALGQQFKYQIQNAGYTAKAFKRTTVSSNTSNRILGGGGVLHDWYGVDHLKQRLAYVSGGENGYIIGVGVPGFQSVEACELVCEVLPQMEKITVRDQWSKKNIKSICDVDVEVTACPALLYDDPDVDSNGMTGVNFRPYFNEPMKSDMILKKYFEYNDLENAHSRYIENVKRISNSIENPIFIPFHKKDKKFANKYLDIPTYPYEFSVEKTLNRVSEVDRMVATRYHSLVFAAICGKPVLTLAYSPKVRSLADRLSVDSYRPQKRVPLEFSSVSNVCHLKQKAKKNFSSLIQ